MIENMNHVKQKTIRSKGDRSYESEMKSRESSLNNSQHDYGQSYGSKIESESDLHNSNIY